MARASKRLTPNPAGNLIGSPGGPPAGGGGGPSIRAAVGDPLGDSFGSMTHDITQYSASTDGVFLNLQIDFANTVSLPGSGQPDEVIAFLDLDTDQNGGTGILSNADFLCPSSAGLGMDFFVSVSGLGVDVFDSSFMNVGPASAMASGNILTVQVSLALLGGDDGIVNTRTVVGLFQDLNDCAPDGTFLTSDMIGVPTIGQAGLLALALLLLAGALIVLKRGQMA